MVKFVKTATLAIPIAIILGCSFFSRTILVKIPDDFSGWCYLIPVNDTSIISPKSGNIYLINETGVAHIPKSQLDLEKSYILKIFTSKGEITGRDQYTENVQQVTENGTTYGYIQFYIPKSEERGIKEPKYWRDKEYEYRKTETFDSLLKAGIIKFR